LRVIERQGIEGISRVDEVAGRALLEGRNEALDP
jgi:hypothetical protein